MADARHLDPEIIQPQGSAVALRPEKVGVALVQGYDTLAGYLGTHPFPLAPDPAAIRPAGGTRALLKEGFPGGRGGCPKRRHVVLHFEQTPAARATVDHVQHRVPAWAAAYTLEPGPVASLRLTHPRQGYSSSGPPMRPRTALEAATAGPAR